MALSVREAVTEAVDQLAAARIAGPHREASMLIAKVLGDQPEILYREPEKLLSPSLEADFFRLVDRRARREPMSHIMGVREFWSLEFLVGPDVLDPRPDSETLVQAALDVGQRQGNFTSILDLGTGSGCLLLSILNHVPEARGVGVDASEAAIRVAAENAARLGMSHRASFMRGDWSLDLSDQFDLVVSNPPYISEGEMPMLQPEVRLYEPHLALKGGSDGLACYRRIIEDLDRILKPGGHVIFEFGAEQAQDVSNLLQNAGFNHINLSKDLAGIDRCVVASKRK